MAQKVEPRTVTMRDVELVFRNFEGKEGQYNQAGDRNFAVIIPDAAAAEAMAADGWNIKTLNPREEGDDPVPYIPVAVNFKNKPPKIIMISGNGRTHINEDRVEMLDWADLAKVDLTLNAYDWTVNGKSGVKAYLKTMYVTLEEDELDREYSDVENADAG